MGQGCMSRLSAGHAKKWTKKHKKHPEAKVAVKRCQTRLWLQMWHGLGCAPRAWGRRPGGRSRRAGVRRSGLSPRAALPPPSGCSASSSSGAARPRRCGAAVPSSTSCSSSPRPGAGLSPQASVSQGYRTPPGVVCWGDFRTAKGPILQLQDKAPLPPPMVGTFRWHTVPRPGQMLYGAVGQRDLK